MTNDTSKSQRLRPYIYVRFEFGISLGGNRPPRHHGVSYRSLGSRERPSNIPRVVTARSTNYLSTAAHHGPQSQYQARALQASHHYGNQVNRLTQHVPIYYYGGPPVEPQRHSIYYYGGPTNHPDPEPSVQSGRPTRDSRRSSHERGTSAPPPLGDNPWAIHHGAGKAPFSSIYRTEAAIDPWKSLPDIPSQFHSDEEDMVRDAWSVPHGYDVDGHLQNEDSESSDNSNDTTEQSISDGGDTTSPIDVSTFSIGPTGPLYRPGDPGRIRELAGLSSAMVTVDNGFENQWWSQGGRESVVTGEALSISPPPRFPRKSLGRAVAATSSLRDTDPSPAAGVTPVTTTHSGDSSGPNSPVSSHQSLTRSLTTRSDELFFDRRQRANHGV